MWCNIRVIHYMLEQDNYINIASKAIAENRDYGLFIENANITKIYYLRGITEQKALIYKYHNSFIHHKLTDGQQQKITDIVYNAEMIRCCSLGMTRMKGVRHNILSYIEYEAAMIGLNSLKGSEYISLIEFVKLIVLKVLIKELPEKLENILIKLGKNIYQNIEDLVITLPTKINDQYQFGLTIIEVANRIIAEDHVKQQLEKIEVEAVTSSEQVNDDQKESDIEVEVEKKEQLSDAPIDKMGEIIPKGEKNETEITEFTPYIEQKPGSYYKVFTKEFDQIVKAEALASKTELINLRKQLDLKLAEIKQATKRKAEKLQRKLMVKQNFYHIFDQEEGIIDNRKLSQVIITPSYKNYYRNLTFKEHKDTVISLLIDNSGSMRGKPITVAAITADILAKTLERGGIKTEILGFTTVDWKGGKSRRKWAEQGSVHNSGRLNDLRHIIFKTADTPWVRAKLNLALMLKDSILKENIDGEALIWAANRLYARKEKRKILIILSDGAPIDDSTLSTNSENILENHLRYVISGLEQDKNIELFAIGIGHDVGKYYKNATTIKNIDQLGDILFSKLEEML